MSKPPVFVLKSGGFGPGCGTRTHGLLVPNQARYQTSLSPDMKFELYAVVVKYVVKEILPQFYPTFNGSNQG